jgi:hypothetical protein
MQNVIIGSAVIEDAAITSLKLASGAATELFVDYEAGPVSFSNIG